MTWQCFSPEVNVQGFKKCCISSAVEGTDDDMLWEGSEGVGNVSCKCEEDEGTDCKDGESDTSTMTDKGRLNLKCLVYEVFDINNKIFILSRRFSVGV